MRAVRYATMTLTRREFVVGTVAAAALPLHAQVTSEKQSRSASAFRAIDEMVERYMREMNAPGMTTVIADRDGILRAATYGLSERDHPVRPEHLFHIGSITKSFVGIALLQLRDEGKLDLHAPVTRYLPWLRIEPRGTIS